MKKSKLLGACTACAVAMAGTNVLAEQSYIYNRGTLLPEVENTILFKSNHDNPNDRTSSGPLPTGLQGGSYNDGAGNTLEYYKYDTYEDGTPNYCTRFTTTQNTWGQIAFTGDDRATGFVTLEFDAKFMGELNMQWLIFGHDSEGKGIVIPLQETSSGKFIKSKNSDCTNIRDGEWYHIKVKYDLDNDVYTEEMTVDGKTYTTIEKGEGLKNTRGFYMIRFQMRNYREIGKAEAWLDNITIVYETEHSPKLHKDAIITAVDNPHAVVLRTGININRDNNGCTPKLYNNTIMYPLRFLAECYRAKIGYDTASCDISINYNDKTAILNKNNTLAVINGETVDMGINPIVVDGYTYIPLDTAARIFEKNAFVNDENYIIITDYENVTKDKFEKLIKVARGDMDEND